LAGQRFGISNDGPLRGLLVREAKEGDGRGEGGDAHRLKKNLPAVSTFSDQGHHLLPVFLAPIGYAFQGLIHPGQFPGGT
jgi:hypothetical protein